MIVFKKQNHGITLIALVITIIIMLILAGITISLIIGENGLISKAQQAGKNYQDAQTQEEYELAQLLNNSVNGSRENVVISKQEYDELKNDIAYLKEREQNRRFSFIV